MQYTETIHETVRFQNAAGMENALKVYNIQGDVIIEGHAGEEVIVTAEKIIDARRQSDIEKGIEEMKLVVEQENNSIFVYPDAPFINVRKRGDGISYHVDGQDVDYEFTFQITIKVPEQVNIQASTINNGMVLVENILAREIKASNVNGPVVLKNVSGKTSVNTVNGDITADYSESPTTDSEYQTVNGTIEVMYPENLSADIRFQSLHGDLYTDFENIEYLSARVERNSKRNAGGVAFRVDNYSPLRIGSGGPEFSFQVLNGDVYIKRIKS
ncbi:MAG: DUF4097 family beta strand repeat-containing protein [Balneolaceae bacterium]